MNSSRRSYLATLGIGATSIAGCVGDVGPGNIDGSKANNQNQPKITVNEIRLENRDANSHTFHILVMSGGKLVFWKSYTADAAEMTSKGDEKVKTPGGTIWKQPKSLADKRAYTLYARLDNNKSWKSTVFKNLGEDCAVVNVSVNKRQKIEIWLKGCNY